VGYLKVLLTVNTGSSSIRLEAFTLNGQSPSSIQAKHYELDQRSPEKILREYLDEFEFSKVDAVSHRVVHGGTTLVEPSLIVARVEIEIERLIPLAPLHNPVALNWITACRDLFGQHVPQIAVFDTAFYVSLPAVAATYALPAEFSKTYNIRRYGFHGLAHQALWQRWLELDPDRGDNDRRAVSMQLGAGCSITAIRNGQPQDTSMGFSPLEGLVMATRSGDIDPGLIIYLEKQYDLSPSTIEEILNHKSGLLGLSGKSADMRTLLEMESPQAELAVSLYCYRIAKYIGAYFTILGGSDALLFGGGVGENAPVVRKRIMDALRWCGVELDDRANEQVSGKERKISSTGSKIEAWVIPVDEATILAKEAAVVLEKREMKIQGGSAK
jgi:acetate kinase